MQKFWELRAHPLVEKYENIASFFTASVSIASLVAYKYFDITTLLQPATFVVFSYCFVDLVFCKKDLFIHHLLTMSGVYFCYIHNVDIEHTKSLYFSMISTELSSIFLIINIWISDYKGTIMKIIKGINFILLISAFAKLRVYDYYYLLTNPDTYAIISQYTGGNITSSLHAYSTIFGLFIMNLYWFSIICKMIYKGIIIKYIPKINTDYAVEMVLQYTFFANIYAVITKYGTNDAFVYDIFGTFLLGFCSFIYHRTLVHNYKTNTVINYTSNEILIPYVFDTLAIHSRSFFVVLTHFMLDTPDKYGRAIFSAVVHSAGMFWFLVYLLKIAVSGEKFIYDSDAKESNHYKTVFYLFLMIPSGIDCMLIFYNTPSISAKISFLIINVVIAIIVAIQPFYKLNHLLFHAALYMQTCILINCNMILESQQSSSPYFV